MELALSHIIKLFKVFYKFFTIQQTSIIEGSINDLISLCSIRVTLITSKFSSSLLQDMESLIGS